MPSASIYIYDYKNDAATDSAKLREIELANFPGVADFHTLGMAYDAATSTLFAVSHAKAGPRIETFRLDVDKAVATHIDTIAHPLIRAPNAIALIDDKNFYVTNDHFFPASASKVLSLLETYLGLATGTVVRIRLTDGDAGEVQDAQIVARVPFANGIEVLNDTTIAVAATSRGAVYLYEPQDPGSLTYKAQIKLPFMPDNLSSSGGKLMIAGHPHAPSLTKFAETRHVCNDATELLSASAKLKEFCETGLATSWAAEWSESEGLRHLYVGTDYPSSATVVKDANLGMGIIAGLYAKGILVWRE